MAMVQCMYLILPVMIRARAILPARSRATHGEQTHISSGIRKSQFTFHFKLFFFGVLPPGDSIIWTTKPFLPSSNTGLNRVAVAYLIASVLGSPFCLAVSWISSTQPEPVRFRRFT
ncbi:hypothetical protein BX600DRAFT_29755 [Xylariales sp. PMI_506]|nr:hypothetical protein BX600DRAFT_29755 [Xylariales sp. PMI_506]